MAMKVLSSAPSAMTGMGGHLMLGYQKSVTTHASHSADSWVLEQSFKAKIRNLESEIWAVF